MREYLKKTLRQNVKIKENNDLYDRLPLAFKGRYDLFDVEINGIDWLAIQPKAMLVLLRSERTELKFRIFQDLTVQYFLNRPPLISRKNLSRTASHLY